MAVKSVGFAIGNLRARENRLLKIGDLNQLAAAKSTDELAKKTSGTNEFPTALNKYAKKLYRNTKIIPANTTVTYSLVSAVNSLGVCNIRNINPLPG